MRTLQRSSWWEASLARFGLGELKQPPPLRRSAGPGGAVVMAAPEPSEVIWENLELDDAHQHKWQARSPRARASFLPQRPCAHRALGPAPALDLRPTHPPPHTHTPTQRHPPPSHPTTHATAPLR